MKLLWNILSYMLIYGLLGFIIGLGFVNGILLIFLGTLSYLLNWFLLRSLNLSEIGVITVKKRFLVFEWKYFYINLLSTVLIASIICVLFYLALQLSSLAISLDWRYALGCWVLVYVNMNNIYEITFHKENTDAMLLKWLREDRLTNKIYFVNEKTDTLTCYATFRGMKKIMQWSLSSACL